MRIPSGILIGIVIVVVGGLSLLVGEVPIGGTAPAPELTIEQQYRMGLIEEMKAFGAGLGFSETENFRKYADELDAYHYYFYTPVTTLPYSLGDPELRFGTGTRTDVTIDLNEYDAFFYSMQAMAGVKTPVTRGLMEAPLSRFIHCVFHEEWHEQIDLPLVIEEPNAEIVSHIAGMLFAEEKWGRDAEPYTTLKRQLQNKLREAAVYVDYYDRLEMLYSRFHSGELSRLETLRVKDDVLDSLGQELEHIWGGRPDQLNNAFIAFQMTYYRNLRLMYQVFLALDSDLHRTVALFRSLPGEGESAADLDEIKAIEAEVVGYLEDILTGRSAMVPSG